MLKFIKTRVFVTKFTSIPNLKFPFPNSLNSHLKYPQLENPNLNFTQKIRSFSKQIIAKSTELQSIMTTIDTSHMDLECGYGHHRSCSSDADSCYSQFYSTVDNHSFACASDVEKDSVMGGSRRASSATESECPPMRETEERDCRICHVSLENGDECGVGIELGCSCKDDLAAAHKGCAEAWFKIKGNKTCEICNSVARNVFSSNETESTQEITTDLNVTTTNAVPAQAPSTSTSTESRACINGHRIVNFLLACMVFIFIISWLFHFNIQS